MGKALHVLVEGDCDEDFVTIVVEPWLVGRERYDQVIPFRYANKKKGVVEDYVEAVKRRGEDLLCLTDSTHSRCVPERVRTVIDYEIGTFDPAMVFVVVKEIEGWYLAGVDSGGCRKMGIRYVARTDQVKKEDFNQLIAEGKFKPRSACRHEMLRNYDLRLASTRNGSLCRLFGRFLEQGRIKGD